MFFPLGFGSEKQIEWFNCTSFVIFQWLFTIFGLLHINFQELVFYGDGIMNQI